MKKLKKSALDELAKEMPLMSEMEQKAIIGGKAFANSNKRMEEYNPDNVLPWMSSDISENNIVDFSSLVAGTNKEDEKPAITFYGYYDSTGGGSGTGPEGSLDFQGCSEQTFVTTFINALLNETGGTINIANIFSNLSGYGRYTETPITITRNGQSVEILCLSIGLNDYHTEMNVSSGNISTINMGNNTYHSDMEWNYAVEGASHPQPAFSIRINSRDLPIWESWLYS